MTESNLPRSLYLYPSDNDDKANVAVVPLFSKLPLITLLHVETLKRCLITLRMTVTSSGEKYGTRVMVWNQPIT